MSMLTKKPRKPSNRILIRVSVSTAMCNVSMSLCFLVLATHYTLLSLWCHIKCIKQHVRQIAKQRLCRPASCIAGDFWLVHQYGNNVLRRITSHESNVCSVVFVGVVSALRLGNFCRSGLAPNTVCLLIELALERVVVYYILQQRLHLVAYL